MLQTKEEIAGVVKSELCKVMAAYGYEILQALVTDIDPAPKVKDAMNEINAAQRLRYVGRRECSLCRFEQCMTDCRALFEKGSCFEVWPGTGCMQPGVLRQSQKL